MNSLIHLFFQQQRYFANQLNDMLKPHGLYHAQWTILTVLQAQGPLTLTQIWKYLNVEAPTVTRTVTRLEKLGYVSRKDGKDRREKIIYLTPTAQRVMPEIWQDVKKFEEKMLGNLTLEEQQVMQDLLRKMKGRIAIGSTE